MEELLREGSGFRESFQFEQRVNLVLHDAQFLGSVSKSYLDRGLQGFLHY